MILGYVMVHPGDTYTDIKRNLLLSNGTLSYHLRVMERQGLIRSQTRGPRKMFFSREARVPEDGGGLHEIQVRMFRAIAAVPGLAVKDIAGALGITSQHALYHLRALAAQGFVRLERRGLNLRCFAEPGKVPPLHDASDDAA
jgi:predicted transcriptional regulator